MAHSISLASWFKYPDDPTYRGDNPFNDSNVSQFTATPASETSVNLAWLKSDYPEATSYLILRSSIGGALNFAEIANIAASNGSYTDTGLAANTEHVYLLWPQRSSGTYTFSMAMAVTLSAPANTIVVNNDAELIAAVVNPTYTDIRMAAGTYTSAIETVFQGEDRLLNKLTVRADDNDNPPTISNTKFDMAGAWGIRFYNLDISLTGISSLTVFDKGASTDADSIKECSFCYIRLTGEPRASVTDPTPTAYYSDGLCNFLDLGGGYCRDNNVFGCELTWLNKFADMKPNGYQLIAYNKINYWYFDVVRMTGQGDSVGSG